MKKDWTDQRCLPDQWGTSDTALAGINKKRQASAWLTAMRMVCLLWTRDGKCEIFFKGLVDSGKML